MGNSLNKLSLTTNKSEVAVRKGDCKEVRVEGKIGKKDLQMKADQVKRLMDSAYRVKGNEKKAMGNEDQNLGGLLARFYALIEDVSIVESGPRVEKKLVYVIVRHVKFGPSKRGSKKASIVEDTSSQVEKVSISAAAINPVSERPVLDSTTPESHATEAPRGTENRYKKEPRNRFPPSKETFFAGPDPRRLQAQFPNQDRQPQQFPNQSRQPQQYPNQGRQLQFDFSTSLSSRETNHVKSGASILGSLKLPADQFPSQEHSRPGVSSAPNSSS